MKLPKVAGSAAHYDLVIGQAYTLIDAEASIEAIVKAIVRGQCDPAGAALSLLRRIENQGCLIWNIFEKRQHEDIV
ncbi:MAG: PHP-associated domain-containing protein [Candidatus Bathyarchaeia archaeon]